MPARSRPPRSRALTAALALLCLLLALLPLVRGAVDLPVEGGALLLATAAAALATWADPALPRPALALAAIAGWIGLQAIPVPPLLHALSPAARSVFETSLAPLGLYPAARPLSVDPPATARELAKALTCVGAFVAAAAFAATRRRRRTILVAFALAPIAVALTVLGAALLGLEPLLAPTVPFVNPNHLAGFLALGGFAGLGFALHEHGARRVLWLLGFAAVTAASFVSLSRAGIAAFFFGAGLFAVLGVARAGRRSDADPERTARRPARTTAVVGALAVGFGTAAYVALDPVIAEMRTLRGTTEESKLQLWGWATPIVRDYPLTGMGRGAFATAFDAYRTDAAQVTYTHVENEWLQAVVDLGLPFGILLVATLAWSWWSAARREEPTLPEIGVFAGTAALVVHNLFDFSLQILGVAVPFSIALGVLARDARRVAVPKAVLRPALALALAAGGAGLLLAHLRPTDEAASISEATTPEDAVARAQVAAQHHPADYLPHAIAGARLVEARRCQDGLPWLLRAMALGPTVPEPHLYAARCLARGGDPALARREYRLAFEYGRPDALGEAAARWPAAEQLYDVVPPTPEGYLALGNQLLFTRPDDARDAYARALDQFGDPRAVIPLARATLATGDRAGALGLARRREQGAPNDPDGYQLAASVLLLDGHEDEARAELERGLGAIPGSAALLSSLADRALAARRFGEAKRLAEEIAPRSAAEVAGKHVLAARALAAQGRLSEAIERGESAAAAAPDSAWPLLFVSQIYVAAGRSSEAIAAVERAAALPGQDPAAYSERLVDLHRALDAQRQDRDRDLLDSAQHPQRQGDE